MIRVVIDTNIYISALVFGGRPSAVVQLAESGAFQVVVSTNIKDELVETLTTKFGWTAGRVERACRELWHEAHWVLPAQEVEASRDPDDNPILGCALESGAHAIVTGDQDLLCFTRFEVWKYSRLLNSWCVVSGGRKHDEAGSARLGDGHATRLCDKLIRSGYTPFAHAGEIEDSRKAPRRLVPPLIGSRSGAGADRGRGPAGSLQQGGTALP